MTAPSPDPLSRGEEAWHADRCRAGGVAFDRVEGIGAVPDGADIERLGATVLMRPSTFLLLAAPLDATNRRPASLAHLRGAIARGRPIAPPTLTALVALGVLVADLFVPAERKQLLGGISIAGLAAALALLLPLRSGDRATFCLTAGAQTDGHAQTAGCSYTADTFTLVIQLLVLGGALLTALLSLPACFGPSSFSLS